MNTASISPAISKNQTNSRQNDDGLHFNKEMVPGGNETNEGFNLNPDATVVDPPYQEGDRDLEDFGKPGGQVSSEKNNQVTDGSNQDSSANLLQHIDGMAMDVNANNVELIKAALGDNVEAIEITVTPEISQLGNLVKDVEKSLKENAEFKNTMNENYMKTKIELDTRAQANPVALVAEDDKKLMIAKRAMKLGIVCIVLLSLVVAFTALLISNSSDDPQIWPQTVTYNDSSILKLNVGGMKDIEVSYTTLVSVPGSKLAQDFAKPQQVEEDGTVFVNRAHFPFRLMLHYLRNSLEIPDIENDQELQLFQQELAYWRIPLRKLTPVEKTLIHEFNSKPSNPLLISNVLEQWATLKPFNLYRFIENATIVVPPHYSILDLKRAGVYQWKGQGHQEVGHGVGRNMGGFGLYEGQYFEGLAHGYGRIIWRNKNSYQGYFKDGKADGQGTYSIQSRNVKYSGRWRAGTLEVSSYPDNMAGFAIPEPFSPPVRRFQTAAERRLEQMFGPNNLVTIYRTYLDKFPEEGTDVYPSFMTAKNQRVFMEFAATVAPLYVAKNANLDLTKLLDMEMFNFDSSLRISEIYDVSNLYAGQVEAPETSRQLQGLGASKPAGPTLSAHGYGRSFGAWGIYVGQYTRGRVDGYGQMTMKTKNTYRGFTSLGRPHGSGIYTFDNGTVVRGEWKNGTLIVSIRADGREGFTPKDLIIPTCSRVLSQKEIQLNAMFSKAPQFDALPANFSAIWSRVGPFDVFGCVGSGDCILNTAADVVHDPLGVYQGEAGRRENNEYTYNMGIGRYQGYWGMFEGATFQNASKSNLRGRIIWNDGSVYEGYFFFQLDQASGLALDTDQPFSPYGNSSLTLANGTRLYYSETSPQQKGQHLRQSWLTWTKVVGSTVSNYYYPNATLFGPRGYRIIGGNEAKMVKVFESEPKLLSSLVQKRWKLAGVFDLYGLVTNGMIVFNETLGVETSPGKEYVGQTPKNYTGLGRQQNQFIYEGQFRAGLFHGVGRLIAANGTVSSGVFANGAYAARNVTEYKLLQLFASRPSNFTSLEVTDQTQIKAIQSTWASLGPFALEEYLNSGKLFFVARDAAVFSQASMDAPSGRIFDQGMIGDHSVYLDRGARRLYGIGRRIQTTDSNKKLQMFEGSVFYQYGRIIYSDGRYFIGSIRFKPKTDGKNLDPTDPSRGVVGPPGPKGASTQQVVAGNGTMYLPGGTRQIGDIYAGKYRTQYAKELKLLAMFESRPGMEILNASVAATWDKVGPFQMEAYISEGYIRIDEQDMKAVQPQIAEVNTKQFQYQGIVRFGYPSQLDIIGRLGLPWGLYEGAVSNGTFGAQQYGRTIYNDGTVYVGYHQADGAPIFGSPLAYNYFVLKDGSNVTSAAAKKSQAPYAGLAKSKIAGKVERKQSAVEVEFLKITNSTLYEYTHFNGTANVSSTLVHPGAYLSYMYKFPIIIEIANFLNAGNITTPDASIPVTKILSEQLIYGGQVDPSTLEVTGVGRLQGTWGLYVGEYYKDKLSFGVMFLKDGYYIGQLKNWKFSGQGTFYKLSWDLSNVDQGNTSLVYLNSVQQGRGKSSSTSIGKTTYSGEWLDNKLVKPAAGSSAVVVNDTVNPTLRRPESQIEKDLDAIFKSDLIVEVPAAVKAKWQKLGPFSIYGPISDGRIALLQLQVHSSVSRRYEGQMNSTGGPQGVGRQQGAWGLYEGVIADRIANGYGRAIWADGSSFIGTFKNGNLVSGVLTAANGTSIPIASSNNQPIPKIPPFLSKTEYELIALFNSVPTGLPANYAAIYKRLGPFALEKYVNTGVITLNKALKISSLPPKGSYKGQTNSAGTAPQGLGRQFSAATGFYEGEFKDNTRNGYGRLIAPNGDTYTGNFKDGKYFGFGTLQMAGTSNNSPKVQTGYFVDGTYIGDDAAAKLKVELVEIFQSPLAVQNQALVTQWNQLGPFDLLSALKAGELTLDTSVPITKTKNYQGQGELATSKASIGRQQSASNVTEGNQGYFPGYLRVIYANQSSYQGGWSNGAPNGKGTKVSASGTVSTGSWKDGQLSGAGSVNYTNGTTMRGTWSNGKLDGQGTVSYSDGTTKTGTWKNGQLAGQGTITYSNGTVAQGNWKAGQLSGQGTVTYSSGLIKKGNWANGQLSGVGTVTEPDGTVRAGTWSNGRLNGSGTVTYKNGTTIAGNWQNGLLSGLGNVTYTNGTIINGYYVKGVYVMSGTMYSLTAIFNSTPTNQPPVPAALVKRWQEIGPLDFQGAVKSKKLTLNENLGIQNKTLNSTSSYKGQVIQAGPSPYIGRIVSDGIFEGNFINSLLNGFGRIIYKNQDWYIGHLENGLPSGLGNYTYANGTRRSGSWKNGQWQMSLTQYDLQKIFEQTPDYKAISSTVRERWQKYGIFNLTALVEEKKIVLDESLVVSTIQFDASIYFGQKANDVMNGVGRRQSTQLQEGLWVNGQLNGYGRVFFEDGRVYVGEFKDQEKFGEGRLYYPDGAYQEGTWAGARCTGRRGPCRTTRPRG